MSKFNQGGTRPAVFSPVVTERVPSGATHEGGPGYLRNARSELFLLAVSNMVGEQTFYESADQRDSRYSGLVRNLAVDDPEWTGSFLRWLRSEGNMRSASLVGAAEFTKGRLDAGKDGYSRQVVASACQRADEPGEMLAYWTSTYGRAVPKPVKRGVADAATRLVGFADGVFRHDVAKGASVIREVDKFVGRIGEVGHGTDIPGSLRRTYAGHDRVFIISDMQTIGGHYGQGVADAVPPHVPIYGFNLGGYQHAAYATGSGNRHEFGGLNDHTFRMVPLLEAGRNADWSVLFGS